ncbi:MAG: MBL fold metallo-hydrolase [Candidatus Eisenbacteria bacterium]|nr:MBL fold metallo-hydrolase [Candidatus Eisenbacteria bacterium]
MSLRVVFHKVGAGQSVHVFSPNGRLIVVDLGSSAEFSPLTWLRRQRQDIDLLIVTHPHGDHLQEILALDRLDFQIQQFFRPGGLSEADVYGANQRRYQRHVAAYLQLAAAYSAPISAPEHPIQNPDRLGGASLSIYAPPGQGRANINNLSLVVVLKYASSTIVIPGDNEPSSWQALLQDPAFVAELTNVAIFMASHHGRQSGYCAQLFAADGRKPRLFVISDGTARDTDAAPSYSRNARGWTVHSRSGRPGEKRYALTTRADGPVDVVAGYQPSGFPFLSVTVD